MHVSKYLMWCFLCVYGVYGVGTKHGLCLFWSEELLILHALMIRQLIACPSAPARFPDQPVWWARRVKVTFMPVHSEHDPFQSQSTVRVKLLSNYCFISQSYNAQSSLVTQQNMLPLYSTQLDMVWLCVVRQHRLWEQFQPDMTPFYIQALRIRLWHMEKEDKLQLSAVIYCIFVAGGISFSWGAKAKISANPSLLQNSENCTINHHRLYTPLLGELAAKPGNETTPTSESAHQLRTYVQRPTHNEFCLCTNDS